MKYFSIRAARFFSVVLIYTIHSAFAQGTGFVYDGRLTGHGLGERANHGRFDFQFKIFDDGRAGAGQQIGLTVTNADVSVEDGIFRVVIDPGSGVFEGADRWLEIGVRVHGVHGRAFTVLGPREMLAPAPYAIFASEAATVPDAAIGNAQLAADAVAALNLQANSVTSAKIADGQVVKRLNGLSDNVTLSAGTNILLTSAGDSIQISAVGNLSWGLAGNGGTVPGSHFVGTTDLQPLEFKVNSTRALRLEPAPPNNIYTGSVNVIGGSIGNLASNGIVGATIAGGGWKLAGNSVNGNFGSVSGGYANASSGEGAVVAGGMVNRSTGPGSTVGGGSGNLSAGDGATIGGGRGNNSSFTYCTVAGGGLNTSSGAGSTVGGGELNISSGYGSTVAGGYANVSSDFFGTVGGGYSNTNSGEYTTIAGGGYNTVTGYWGTVPGGYHNVAGGSGSFAAGYRAIAVNDGAFVWADSTDSDFKSTMPNQYLVRASGGVGIGTNRPQSALHVNGAIMATSFSGSGAGLTAIVKSLNGLNDSVTLTAGANITLTQSGNDIQISASGSGSTAWSLAGNAGTSPGANFLGTSDNKPFEIKVNSTRALRVEPNASDPTVYGPNIVGGYLSNSVTPGVNCAVICGGGMIFAPNRIASDFSTIGGGDGNTIQENSIRSVIAGGEGNTILAGAWQATINGGAENSIATNANNGTIGGGYLNVIQTNSENSTVSGGQQNTIETEAHASTIGGGIANTIGTAGGGSVIAGGSFNTIEANATLATIAGGQLNVIHSNAFSAAVGGGFLNSIETYANQSAIAGGYANTIKVSSFSSTVGGGQGNAINGGAPYATIPGGYSNSVSGPMSLAAGYRAKANHQGTFVWADSQDFDFPSTAVDSFSVRAVGGARFVTGVDVVGHPATGVALAPGGASWGTVCDRDAKKNFQPVDGKAVVACLAQIPIQRWNYKSEPDGETPHIGPVAQDFKAAFFPGRDNKVITTLEFDGVELAAIQGLAELVKEKEARILALEKSVEELKASMRDLVNSQNGTHK